MFKLNKYNKVKLKNIQEIAKQFAEYYITKDIANIKDSSCVEQI